MTAKDFFDNQISTNANSCVVSPYRQKYSRNDLIKFAEAYHQAKEAEKHKFTELLEIGSEIKNYNKNDWE